MLECLHGRSDNSQLSNALGNLGVAYRERGQLVAAWDFVKRSLDMSKRLFQLDQRFLYDVALALARKGHIYSKLGMY